MSDGKSVLSIKFKVCADDVMDYANCATADLSGDFGECGEAFLVLDRIPLGLAEVLRASGGVRVEFFVNVQEVGDE